MTFPPGCALFQWSTNSDVSCLLNEAPSASGLESILRSVVIFFLLTRQLMCKRHLSIHKTTSVACCFLLEDNGLWLKEVVRPLIPGSGGPVSSCNELLISYWKRRI